MKKCIAITGGIGSGKSTVINIIKEEGYPVFSCDEIYKEVVLEKEYIAEIEKNFPSVVEKGNINRRALSHIVFSNEKARETLDNLSHPRIMARLLERMRSCEADFVFAEVPLLLEGGYENLFDNVIVVLRREKDRLHDVMQRDNAKEEDVLARMRAQFDYDNINNRNINGAIFINNDAALSKLKTSVEIALQTITK